MVNKVYPHKYWSSTATCFLGGLQTTLIGIILRRDRKTWKLGWDLQLLTIVYTVKATGICKVSRSIYNINCIASILQRKKQIELDLNRAKLSLKYMFTSKDNTTFHIIFMCILGSHEHWIIKWTRFVAPMYFTKYVMCSFVVTVFSNFTYLC